MRKTIFNVFVPMKNQEQCNRMKQLCIDNGLPYWKDEIAFIYGYQIGVLKTIDIFSYSLKEFAVWSEYESSQNSEYQVTESEFIELLKEYKNE